LPLPDKALFKLPIYLRKQQGNQQLQLWIKHANLAFDLLAQQAEKYWQMPITDWATSLTEKPNIHIKQYQYTANRHVPASTTQTDITNWLKPSGGTDCDDTTTVGCSIASEQYHGQVEVQKNANTATNREIVTGGISQGLTTNMCTLVN
jgi:type II secretory pathway pseudopilin PulG